MKNLLIRQFVRLYKVDMTEAVETEAEAYAHFNAFFTRALKPECRPISPESGVVLSPCDGAISQIGSLEGQDLFQAKGHYFNAETLLACDKDAALFDGGSYATIYLSPRDYHRVHMPCGATLNKMRHIPGKLFSVNEATCESVPGLFARNERVVCMFETENGPMAMVLVGAMIVASIATSWSGLVTPAGKVVTTTHYDRPPGRIQLEKGEEMGLFQLGSTVILLFPRNTVSWAPELSPTSEVRLGASIAQYD